METGGQSLDRISTLPENIIEYILTLMPIQDALRTSTLSKKWRYSWRTMPKLVFTEYMVEVPSECGCDSDCDCNCGHELLKKYKLLNAIFHVLLLHNGPTILVVDFLIGKLQIFSEFDLIISYLSRRNSVKELIFVVRDGYYNLPVSIFSVQGLEHLHLKNCGFELPLTFNGFSRLRKMVFSESLVSAKMLQGFLSKCPLLDELFLSGYKEGIDFSIGGNKFTLADLCRCVPLIRTLGISKYYVEYLCADGMPHKLPTSLAHLRNLYLCVCLMEPNEISSVLCMIRSSPLLVELIFQMWDNEKLPIDQQTPNNFLDLDRYLDLKLDHLEKLEIHGFNNSHLEMKFVKLIMAKSPMLKKVQLWLDNNVYVDEELKLLRDWLVLPFPRASASAKLFIERPKA